MGVVCFWYTGPQMKEKLFLLGFFLVHRKDFITKLSFKSLCFQSEVFLVN